MKTRAIVFWALFPILVAGIVYSASSGAIMRYWTMWTGSGPILDCPRLIELGEQELGQIAVARFTVANRGGEDLVLDKIQANCACTGLELEKGTNFIRVESLRLHPGESAPVAVRATVRGRPGDPLRIAVMFHSNDATRPEPRIEIVVSKIKGGIYSLPTSVIFGPVVESSEATQVIEVRDQAVTPRAIMQVESTLPDRFTARLISGPVQTAAPPNGTDGVVIGRVEVVLNTNEVGPINGAIKVTISDAYRPPDVIPVTGHVLRQVQAYPALLVLPRRVGAAGVYSGECRCISTQGKPLTIRADAVPAGFTIHVTAVEGDPATQIVQIEWDPQTANPGRSSVREILRFRATVAGKDAALEIPVQCNLTGGS